MLHFPSILCKTIICMTGVSSTVEINYVFTHTFKETDQLGG
jgi:hypothetical protein